MLMEETGSSSSEEQEAEAEEKKETSPSTPTTMQEKQHEEKYAEEKADSPILSAREIRSKCRRDKVGAGHVSPITSPALTSKQKDKTTAAKRAKVKTPITTGKEK